MARPYCTRCSRPKRACICALCTPVDNDIRVLILQHPTEVAQAKGSVTLLAKSLQNCQVLVAEDFSDHDELNGLLQRYQGRCYLLYPDDNATDLADFHQQQLQLPRCLLLLDATWKKSYRMYCLSHNLHALPKLALAPGIENRYQIRKTTKAGALSTLEACCHSLSLLEQAPKKYQKLLDNFVNFNDFQLSFQNANRRGDGGKTV